MHPDLRRCAYRAILLALLVYTCNPTKCTFSAASSLPEFLLPRSAALAANLSLEHLDPTLPPSLSAQAPKCSVLALRHDFANTVGTPPASANYTQPVDCPAPWTRVVLDLSVSATDVQEARIAAVWIDGAEILRTSTPLPMAPGAFWRVQKDVTRYTALLRRMADGGVIYMMLENSNASLPGVYSANVSLHFYRGPIDASAARPSLFRYTAHPTVKGLYRNPADLIVPVSQPFASDGHGFCFRVNNESHVPTAPIAIPRNTYRAVLEVFASYHADDEFWYTNPLRSAYESGRGGLGAGRANGGFRQLYATIDGQFVGGHIPFAVIYPGSINPYFWTPVMAIGAFDLPSYDLDVTPMLGLLLDGGVHQIGLGVKNSQSYWLLTANLHLWVDAFSDAVAAGVVEYSAPPLKMNRNAEWRNQDGQSEVDAEGLMKIVGWVSSSHGNLTTVVRQKVKFKSQVEVQNRGAVKQVELINKQRLMVAVHKGHQLLGRAQLFSEAPLQMQTSTVNAVGGAVFQKTRLSHQLLEEVSLVEGQAASIRTLADRQDAEGSALMHEGAPVWGSGSTKSLYKYRDEATCYLRTVNTAGGLVKLDTANPSCAAVGDA